MTVFQKLSTTEFGHSMFDINSADASQCFKYKYFLFEIHSYQSNGNT